MNDDRTPPHTPSAQLKLGLVGCPACHRTGKTTADETCFYCEGARVVTIARGRDWDEAHPDTPLPDTEPEKP